MFQHAPFENFLLPAIHYIHQLQIKTRIFRSLFLREWVFGRIYLRIVSCIFSIELSSRRVRQKRSDTSLDTNCEKAEIITIILLFHFPVKTIYSERIICSPIWGQLQVFLGNAMS